MKIYYELCNNDQMQDYSFFNDKLKAMQKIASEYQSQNSENIICDKCVSKKSYIIGNIVWNDNIIHKIKHHQKYPSNYFANFIAFSHIEKNILHNPPIILNPSEINKFKYIPFNQNKLLIIDALMESGSNRIYNTKDKNKVYSEHSGGIIIDYDSIDNISVSAETQRINANDPEILLPINNKYMDKQDFLFHTHPNTGGYGGRISQGVLIECPSPSDISNYVSFANDGKVQGSLIVAPEGIYLIRNLSYQNKLKFDDDAYKNLHNNIIDLEREALKKNKKILKKLKNPDVFHKHVSSDYSFINKYNKIIEPYNIFVEYYPRIKENGKWHLPNIHIQYVNKN
jgi:hypothetical protein